MRRCTRRWKHRHPYRVPRLTHPTEHPQALFRGRNVFSVCVGVEPSLLTDPMQRSNAIGSLSLALVSLGCLCRQRRDRLASLNLHSLLVVLYGDSRNRLGRSTQSVRLHVLTSKEKRSPALLYTRIIRRSRSKQPFRACTYIAVRLGGLHRR